MKNQLSLKAQLWLPTIFAGGLSLIVMAPALFGSKAPQPIPFYLFLPFAFFFAARVTYRYIVALEEGIAALEQEHAKNNG